MSNWGRSFHFALLISSTLIFISCGSKSDDTKEYPFPTFDTTSALKKEMESASLFCDTAECEANKSDFESIGLVGMVVEGDATSYWKKMGQCTGFLYGSNDIVGLNSHCISPSMWQNKNNCGGVLAIKFPEANGKPMEVRNCLEIIYQTDISDRDVFNIPADYAFFRIQPVDRNPLPLATKGTPNNQLVTVRKVNPLASHSTLGGSLN